MLLAFTLADHAIDKIYSIKYFCNTEVPGLGSEKIFDYNNYSTPPSFSKWYRKIRSTDLDINTLVREIKVIILLKSLFHIAFCRRHKAM